MPDEEIRVPAGWYPDPLGLPQLRWWDNHAWTEHTTEARGPSATSSSDTGASTGSFTTTQQTTIPTVVKSTRLSFADPFEDYEDSYEDGPVDAGPTSTAYGSPTLQLEGLAVPETDQIDAASSPGVRIGTVPAGAPMGPAYTMDQRFDDLIGGFTTTEIIDEPTYAPQWTPQHRTSEPVGSRRARDATPAADWTPPEHAHTGSIWAIALMPIAILVPGLLFLLSGLAGSGSSIFFGLVLLVPYIVTAGLAFSDATRLRELGFIHPAGWGWALLGAPVYLVARSRAVTRELPGHGSAPLATWIGMGLLVILSGVIAPGLVLSLSPQTFSTAAAESIEAQAAQFAITIDVSCPPTPPLLPGQTFVCQAMTEMGDPVDLTVALERDLGWITWRVTDWGGMR